MPEPQGLPDSSDEDFDDDAAVLYETQGDEHTLPSPSPTNGTTPVNPQKSSHPIQKRRRVTRACDECRRKKIKCDGKQPCTHCTVYSYECTYDQPSNRRRNPAPHYVEALEAKLQRAQAIIKSVLPDVDLDDQSLDDQFPSTVQPGIKLETAAESQAQSLGWESLNGQSAGSTELEKDSMLESMVETTGSLDLDDEGHWDFHGHSSGRAFLSKMRDQFNDLMGKPSSSTLKFPQQKQDPTAQALTSPSSSSVSSPLGFRAPNINDLPRKDCTLKLCANALEDACAILRFVHQPTFYAMVDRVYERSSEALDVNDIKFLPLLYSTIALGTLFATNERSELLTNGFDSAIEQGNHFFKLTRSSTDITDCRDIMSLQTLLMMILFLQSSSRLSTCYSHLGIALRSAIRMGLHRNVRTRFNPVEQEVRKRIFWCVLKLDIYVGALLGLPKMLVDEDIDQEFPLEVDDDYITTERIRPMPRDKPSLMAAFNAHTRIVKILAKTVKYIYPIKVNKSKNGQSYIVSHARIREIEQDLQNWFESLPTVFRPGMEAPKEFIRIQHLLRMAYAHIEMVLYRPFLHYVASDTQAKKDDKRSYACASACVSVSRNIVHLTGEMKRKGLLVGSYWFYMYTTFFAVISLIFFVLENPRNETSAAILRDAHEGKDTLAGLAKRSLAADRCSEQLTNLFNQFPDRLQIVKTKPISQKRRQGHSPSPNPVPQPLMVQSAPDVHRIKRPDTHPQRSQTAPGSGPWSQENFNSSQQLSQQHRPYNVNYRRASNDTFTVSGPTSNANLTLQTSSSGPGMPLSRNSTQADFPDLSAHSVPDLSAMMFPTSDPFAYPNQPMTTLENQNHIKQEEGIFSPGLSTTSAGPPPFPNASFDAQFNGLSNYVLSNADQQQQQQHRQQQQADWAMQGMNDEAMTMNGNDDLAGIATSWPPPQQQVNSTSRGIPPSQGSYDQIFGEDWGGWMNQGYRQ